MPHATHDGDYGGNNGDGDMSTPPRLLAPPPQVVPLPLPSAAVPTLTDGWCAQTDPSDGTRYFWHPATGAATWDIPFASGPQQDAYP
jgi:hypothetical protein